MIGYLQGKVISCDGKKCVLLTNSGVGYEINYGYYADIDHELGLHIHHHITDSDQSLWGFNKLEDKKLFELLKTVNKVGSSKAYPLVTQLGLQSVMSAISLSQDNVLSSVKGIGKKMAEQIILTLKDKIKDFGNFTLETTPALNATISKIDGKSIDPEVMKETLQALESLGYKDKDVLSLIQTHYEENVSSSELIKVILKEL